jgi:chemotaxis protein methyltransferase CheR
MKAGARAWNPQIIASDIRSSALQEAERGLYPEPELQNLAGEIVKSYFAKLGEHFLVKPRLRNMITFSRMNLVKPNYIGRFDCVFCMDVLPHFSISQRISLIERLHLCLQPGGFLFLGQGETLPIANVVFDRQRYSDYTLYQRPLAIGAATGQ